MLNIDLMYSTYNKENYPFSACIMLLSCLSYSSKLKLKATFSSKTSVKVKRTARRYITENITPLMLKLSTFSYFFIRKIDSRCSAFCIATDYALDRRGFGVRVLKGQGSSPFHAVQTDSGAHLASYQMGICPFFRGQRDWGVKLTFHLQLVPRSEVCASTHPIPHTNYYYYS
jgi:hypothetical protein